MKLLQNPSFNPFKDEISANVYGCVGLALTLTAHVFIKIDENLLSVTAFSALIGPVLMLIAGASLLRGAPRRGYRTASRSRATCELFAVGYLAMALLSPGISFLLFP